MERQSYTFCPRCGTLLKEERIEDRRRQVCPTCEWIHYENPLPCVAALVRNTDGDILMVRRGVEPAKGKWALPSGFVEIEETPEMACLRELEEETGLLGRLTGLLGVFSQESQLYKNVLIIGYRVEAEGETRAGSDSQAVRFFPVSELPDVAFSSHRDMIRAVLKARPG